MCGIGRLGEVLGKRNRSPGDDIWMIDGIFLFAKQDRATASGVDGLCALNSILNNTRECGIVCRALFAISAASPPFTEVGQQSRRVMTAVRYICLLTSFLPVVSAVACSKAILLPKFSTTNYLKTSPW